MNIIKQIGTYLTWTVLALLLGILHMRIVLGAKGDTSTSVLGFMFGLFYDFGLIHLGLIIGCVIAFLFILLDILYLKKKLKKNKKSKGVKFLVLLSITVMVEITHYILEHVIDVI